MAKSKKVPVAKQTTEQKAKRIEKDLTVFAKTFPTDKLDHGYIPFYAEILAEIEVKSLLEIGVWQGNSMRVWRKMFPKAKLHGLDLFTEYPIPTDILTDVQFIKGSQKDQNILNYIKNDFGPFDVVIDDGSHNAPDQWATINTFLKHSKVVIIEDLHCNEDGNGFWNEGMPFEETILGKVRAGKFPYKHKIWNDQIIAVYAD